MNDWLQPQCWSFLWVVFDNSKITTAFTLCAFSIVCRFPLLVWAHRSCHVRFSISYTHSVLAVTKWTNLAEGEGEWRQKYNRVGVSNTKLGSISQWKKAHRAAQKQMQLCSSRMAYNGLHNWINLTAGDGELVQLGLYITRPPEWNCKWVNGKWQR